MLDMPCSAVVHQVDRLNSHGSSRRMAYRKKTSKSFRRLKPSFSRILMRGSVFWIWSFAKIGGPPYRPQNTIILLVGTLQNAPSIVGFPHVFKLCHEYEGLEARTSTISENGQLLR